MSAEQGLLYEEFVRRCFPCLYMNFSRFSELAQSLGWELATHRDLFRYGSAPGRTWCLQARLCSVTHRDL